MRRTAFLAYGALAYAVFGASLLWAVLFLTGVGGTPKVDRGPAAPSLLAVAVDLALLGLFALQHSAMARQAFKRLLTRAVPEGAERSTFVLAASAVLVLLFWQWRPLPATVWDLPGALGALPAAAAWLGWILLVAATFMIDHLDLFGLRQSWHAASGLPYTPPRFQTRRLYAWIRHPIMSGFLVIFWAVPRMTLGHLLFSLAATGYIAAGVWLEERDLLRAIPEYRAYRSEVGAVLPKPSRLAAPAPGTPSRARP